MSSLSFYHFSLCISTAFSQRQPTNKRFALFCRSTDWRWRKRHVSPLIGESVSPRSTWQENEPFLYSRVTGETLLYDYTTYCNGLSLSLSDCRRQLVFPDNSLHANRLLYPLVSLSVSTAVVLNWWAVI